MKIQCFHSWDKRRKEQERLLARNERMIVRGTDDVSRQHKNMEVAAQASRARNEAPKTPIPT